MFIRSSYVAPTHKTRSPKESAQHLGDPGLVGRRNLLRDRGNNRQRKKQNTQAQGSIQDDSPRSESLLLLTIGALMRPHSHDHTRQLGNAHRDGHEDEGDHDKHAEQERVLRRRSNFAEHREQADEQRSTHHQQARDSDPNRFRTRAAKEALKQGETSKQDRSATHSEETDKADRVVDKTRRRDDAGAAKEESIRTHSQRAIPELRAILGVASPHEPGNDTRQMNDPRDAGYGQDRTDKLTVAHHRRTAGNGEASAGTHLVKKEADRTMKPPMITASPKSAQAKDSPRIVRNTRLLGTGAGPV